MKGTINLPRIVGCIAFSLAVVFSTAQAAELSDAKALAAQGQHRAAMEVVEKFLRDEPDDPEALFIKATILESTGDSPSAIELLEKLAIEHPEMPEPHNNLAVHYASQGKYEKAIKSLEKALSGNESYATAYRNLTAIYEKLASEAYRKALNSETPSKKLSLASLNEANSLETTEPRVIIVTRPASPENSDTAATEPSENKGNQAIAASDTSAAGSQQSEASQSESRLVVATATGKNDEQFIVSELDTPEPGNSEKTSESAKDEANNAVIVEEALGETVAAPATGNSESEEQQNGKAREESGNSAEDVQLATSEPEPAPEPVPEPVAEAEPVAEPDLAPEPAPEPLVLAEAEVIEETEVDAEPAQQVAETDQQESSEQPFAAEPAVEEPVEEEPADVVAEAKPETSQPEEAVAQDEDENIESEDTASESTENIASSDAEDTDSSEPAPEPQPEPELTSQVDSELKTEIEDNNALDSYAIEIQHDNREPVLVVATTTQEQTETGSIAPPSTDEQAATTEPVLSEPEVRSVVRHRVESWIEAWTAQDFERYLSHYSGQFTPTSNLSVEQWKTQSEDQLRWREYIIIEISDLVIAVNGGNATASFIMHYKTNVTENKTTSMLQFEQEDGTWYITREII